MSRIEHGTKYCKKSKGIEEKKLHGAICRALKRGIEENREVYSLIEANLTYAVSGQENAFDAFSLEQSIAQKQAQAGDLVKLSLKSEANVEKYESEIAKIYSEIKTLRDQLKQAQKMMENAAQTNEEVARLSGWLANHDAAFEEYDDVVVRRLVETIRVNRDDTITLTIKGGVSITEKVSENQKSD